MKYLVTFVGGMFVGAILALLFAPSSGEELRVQLQTGAEAELKKAEAEWQKAKTSLQERTAKPDQEPEAPGE
jgi:gas vesicle protein